MNKFKFSLLKKLNTKLFIQKCVFFGFFILNL